MRLALEPLDARELALGHAYRYALVVEGTGEVAGGVELTHAPARSFALGYWLEPAWRGRGFATRAAAMLVRFAFERLRARRVEIRCDPNNNESAAVARRLGFVRKSSALWVSYLPAGAGAGAPPMPPPAAGAPPTY